VSLTFESCTALISIGEPQPDTWRLNPNRFSSGKYLTRVGAWVLRFINNCKQVSKDELIQGELSGEEILDAENNIIKEMQKEAFKDEYSALLRKRELSSNSKLLGLCPKLDSDGIIRSDGRLTYAEFLPYDVRYPVILPRKN